MSSPKVSFVSLGCPKNLVDSEVLLGHLVKAGFGLETHYEGSDVVVINTCGFLKASEDESMETIDRMVKLKEGGKLKAVVVAGCLPQRYGPSFASKLRNVDAVLGITDRDKIGDVCERLLERTGKPKQINLVTTDLPKYEIDRDRLRITPPHTAYVRLSEGCNHTCAFCIIPQIRGKFRSKPMEVVVDEVKKLASTGCREVNLIAQDSTNYGLDLYRKLCLDELLEKIAEVDGIEWIRLLYAYPTYVTDRLIEAMAKIPKVVKYVDMPIQHTKERMLRAMRRGMTESGQKHLVRRWREVVPDLTIRTTVIVGFPGETDEDFEGMLEDLRELKFERLGAFKYSREKGTRADEMDGHIAEDVKEERHRRVMIQQQEILFSKHEASIGRIVPVVVEQRKKKNLWVGRASSDAPDIDTVIYLHGDTKIGEIRRARVTGRQDYDLVGDLLETAEGR